MNSTDDEKQKYENNVEKYSDHSESESDPEGESSSSVSSSGSESSFESVSAEWAKFIEEDGSLMYVESYVSSTVKERKAHQAIRAASEYERKGTFPSPGKNLKRHTKLLNLLKRRPSVRVKSNSSTVSDAAKVGGANSQDTSTSPPKVTFRDNPCGEVRDVILRVTDIGSNFGRRASFCEAVLGIMPGRFSEPPDARIMVAGLAPGSQALKDSSIKIGDWLKTVNGTDVNWENLDAILFQIQVPSTVTLSVQKCAAETLPQDDHHNLKRVTQTRLVKFLMGKERKCADWNAMMEKGMLPLHIIIHLSLKGVTEESPDKADVRYLFPAMNSKLLQVRGMFLTLSHSLQEVVGSPVLSATVTLHGIHYHGAFCRDGDDTFLIILPHFCISDSVLVDIMEQICKLIRFEFGSLSSGLSDERNKEYLDHLFLLILEDILSIEQNFGIENTPGSSIGGCSPPFTPSTSRAPNFSDIKSRFMFGSPNQLLLRDEFAKIQLEICLNELQSGDFGDNDSDCEDCLLLYNIIGCTIFYKGHLVLSHLNSESSECVFLFAERHRLLHLVEKEAVSQLVLWKRIFLPQQLTEESQPNREIDHYILFVAMNHFLLATVVESGNVTELMDKDAGPDPFLVDQAETTLYHLHSLHVHSACEESLASSAFETIFLSEKMNSPARRVSKTKPPPSTPEGTPAVRLPDVPSILKQKSPSFDPRDSPTCDCERSLGEGSDDSHSYSPSPRDVSFPEGDIPEEKEEEENSSKAETSSDSEWRIAKGADSREAYIHKPDGGNKGMTPPSLRVTVGEENVLFHLIQLDIGEGVIVTPFLTGEEIPKLHLELLRNFHMTVSHIRHVLLSGKRNKNPVGTYVGSNVLNSIKEYGIMFEISESNKNKTQVAYWVIGRVFGPPHEREIYVALEDSIPQNMQEIAFKVALGCS